MRQMSVAGKRPTEVEGSGTTKLHMDNGDFVQFGNNKSCNLSPRYKCSGVSCIEMHVEPTLETLHEPSILYQTFRFCSI